MSTRPPPLPNSPPSINAGNTSADKTVWIGLGIGVCLFFLFILFLAALSRLGSKNETPALGADSGDFSDVIIGSGADEEAGVGLAEDNAFEKAGEEHRTTAPDKKPASDITNSEDDGEKSSEVKGAVENNYTEIQKFDGIATETGKSSTLTGEGNPFLAAVGSNSTVFVVDVSGSMAGDRSQRVFNALVEAINALNDSQSFLVVLFDGQMHLAKQSQRLEQATAANKTTAIQWLESFSLGGGGTEPLESIFYALAQSSELVLVLSDGEFNPQYVQQITTENSRKKMRCRIDTIGLAEVVEVLRDLAKQNGGVYHQAR